MLYLFSKNSDELLFPEEPAPKKAAPVKKSADPEKYPVFDADEKTVPAAPVQNVSAAPAMNGFEEVDDEDLPF